MGRKTLVHVPWCRVDQNISSGWISTHHCFVSDRYMGMNWKSRNLEDQIDWSFSWRNQAVSKFLTAATKDLSTCAFEIQKSSPWLHRCMVFGPCWVILVAVFPLGSHVELLLLSSKTLGKKTLGSQASLALSFRRSFWRDALDVLSSMKVMKVRKPLGTTGKTGGCHRLSHGFMMFNDV